MSLNKEVKKEGRKARRRNYIDFTNQLSRFSQSEATRTSAAVVRSKQDALRRNQPPTRQTEPKEFTSYIANQFSQEGTTEEVPSYF